jgi:hypothetical protein
MWVRYQPANALSCWFRQRVGSERGRIRRICRILRDQFVDDSALEEERFEPPVPL